MNSKGGLTGPINVFSPYYDCGNPQRQEEIRSCVINNLRNDAIASVTLLVDDNSSFDDKGGKLTIKRLGRRPTYFDWINLSLDKKTVGYSVLCNSDIFFDESLFDLESYFERERTFLALSRWDVLGNDVVPHPNPHWSQDVWAFDCSGEPDPSLLQGLDIPLGVPRCDNKIAYHFAVNGWRVVNPHQRIKAYHLHETGYRAYHKTRDERILGGVAYVHPTADPDLASVIEIDIWAKEAHRIKKVTINGTLDGWNRAARAERGDGEGDPADEGLAAERAIPEPAARGSSGPDIGDFLMSGTVLYEHLRRFRLYGLGDKLLYWDRLYPTSRQVADWRDRGPIPSGPLDVEHLAHWLRPVIDTAPFAIGDRPRTKDDLRFWQYPASTERQAFDNHAEIPLGDNVDRQGRIIHTYLPLPWATFVDKKSIPAEMSSLFKGRIAGLKSLAGESGYTLKVHTVCQHIHWRRLVPIFRELGITDLHLSHCELGLGKEMEGEGLDVHSWPLIAANVENPERAEGLVVAKPVEQKKYLASFIGAHMRHYRSDVRLKLVEEARRDGADDVLVEVNDEWHFNKVVYQEQVNHTPLDKGLVTAHDERTRRYNDILSDSVFSLCPEGAGPNSLRIWESIAIGSIPVIIADDWELPEVPGSAGRIADCCIVLRGDQVGGLFSRLRSYSPDEVLSMQNRCLAIYPLIRKMNCFDKQEIKR